jgi:hypothetical protein
MFLYFLPKRDVCCILVYEEGLSWLTFPDISQQRLVIWMAGTRVLNTWTRYMPRSRVVRDMARFSLLDSSSGGLV